MKYCLNQGLFLSIVLIGLRVEAQEHPHGMPGVDMVTPKSPPASSVSDSQLGSADHQMSHKHIDMGPHMYMTKLRPVRVGDQERAAEVVQQARKAMGEYADYRAALSDSFKIFLPQVPQKMYHFTNWQYAVEAAFTFNPEHPTSLLYEKHGSNYQLIGAMYTAPAQMTEDAIDKRIPLSIAQWHKHVNMCVPPPDKKREVFGRNPRFGLAGSISTKEECEQAGGKFQPVVFGWMVHVYPYEKSQQAIWSIDRQQEERMEPMH